MTQSHESGVREIPIGLEPPDDSCPPMYVGSRESLEAILRRLIRQPEYRVRWLAGTVTGLQLSSSMGNEIEAVTVRLEGSSNEVQTIHAALVLGILHLLADNGIIKSLYVFRLHRR